MRRLVLAFLLTTMSGPAWAADGCTCRYNGGDVFEGQTACINTARGPTLARCERFLNNTSWKFLDQPCPTAQAEPQGRQALSLSAG